MDIQSLEIFVDVARLGSFAETARRHDRDPSQISRIIAGLESSLQIRLFSRSTRKLSLTEAGERYLARVSAVVEELRFAEEEARQLTRAPSGVIRITASTAFAQVCLLPLIPGFYAAYPDITLDLLLTDKNVDLFTENIDIACRLSPAFDSDLIGVKLFDTRYRVCASPDYLRTAGSVQHPENLESHSCVVMSLPQYRSRWIFKDSAGGLSDVSISPRLSVSNALALRDCLLNGIGPGLAANWLVDDYIRTGELVDLFPAYQVTATDFATGAWLLYPSRQYLPMKTQVLIDYLKLNLRG